MKITRLVRFATNIWMRMAIHHCHGCMGQGHKQQMHTSFRNVVYRLASRAGARPILEPDHLLPATPQTRPADVLVISLPDVQQSSWRRFLLIVPSPPLSGSALARAVAPPLNAATRYTELKRKHTDMQARWARHNLGFEPLILESTGGSAGKRPPCWRHCANWLTPRNSWPVFKRGKNSKSEYQWTCKGACMELA